MGRPRKQNLLEASYIDVIENDKGHLYTINNRHNYGSQSISFIKLMSYKDMVDDGFSKAKINKLIPKDEQQCDNCKFYEVQKGCFTQDVLEVARQRILHQQQILPNGFYGNSLWLVDKAIEEYEVKYKQFRIDFGFYHIPFDAESFKEVIRTKDISFLLDRKAFINQFIFLPVDTEWETKEDILGKIDLYLKTWQKK